MFQVLFTLLPHFLNFIDWEKYQNQHFLYHPVGYLLNMGIGGGNVSNIEFEREYNTRIAGKLCRGKLNMLVYDIALLHLSM